MCYDIDMTQHTELRIVDLGEATALLVMGFRLLRLEGNQNRNCEPTKIFIFENREDFTDILTKYISQKLEVDAYSFYRSGRDLKNRIHDHNVSISRLAP